MRRLIVLTVILSSNFAGTLHGQTTNATVTGRVTDFSKGIIADAKVTLLNEGTNIPYVGNTNETGSYYVTELPVGKYRMEVEKLGFKSVIKPDVVLHVQDVLEINFEMAVGSLSESVTVHAGAPTVQLATSSIVDVVGSKTVVELPLNGRDWTTLAVLQPGVHSIPTQAGINAGSARANRGFGNQMSISGTRPQSNNYRLDGLSVVDYAGGGPGSVLGIALGVDAVAEFSVVTSNSSAEYGRTSGGVINAITRSGTNEIHGDAYWFLRDEDFDARNFFDGKIPPFHRNQFGASAGGPIQKDKTFFFADYEGFRQALGATSVDNVPSADARNGIIHNADGTTTTLTVDPLVKPYLAFWPLPNAGLIGAGNTGHFNVPIIETTRENFVTSRIDRKFSEKDSIFGSWFYDNAIDEKPDTLNTLLSGNTSVRIMAALEETHVFSPSLVNSLRGGYSRVNANTVIGLQVINLLAADPSLGTFPGRPSPGLTVSGLTSFNGGVGGGRVSPAAFFWNSFQVYDDALKTIGVHSIKFGFAFERMQTNQINATNPDGNFAFGSLVGFLTNQPLTFKGQLSPGFLTRGSRQSLFGGYLQDDWRLRPNLTVNLGLRYEAITVPTDVHNQLANLPTFTSLPPGHLGSPYFSNPTLRNFEPRVGFSWDPFRDGKTALRGAFGVFDVLPYNYNFLLQEAQSYPFSIVLSEGNLAAGSFPRSIVSVIDPTKLQSQSIQPDPRRNYIMIWNLNVQRELNPSTAVMIGYVGNHGVHMLDRADDVNLVIPAATPQGFLWPFPAGSGTRLNPNIGAIRGVYWDGDSEYDALEVKVTKTMSYGLQAQVSYTWGKSIDTGSSSSVGDPFNNSISSPYWFCKACRRGLSDFNIAHSIVANYIWQIPTPKNWGALGSHALGGWELGGIITAQTGVPFTPVISGDPLGLNSQDPWAYPNRLTGPGCGSAVNSGNPNNYIKLSCFGVPMAVPAIAAQCTLFNGIPGSCSNLLGNVGRNSLIGPGLATWDFSLIKNSYVRKISESFNVQLRAEFFNITNRPNFAAPFDNNALFSQNGSAVGGAGAVDQTSTRSREIQFGLKLIW